MLITYCSEDVNFDLKFLQTMYDYLGVLEKTSVSRLNGTITFGDLVETLIATDGSVCGEFNRKAEYYQHIVAARFNNEEKQIFAVSLGNLLQHLLLAKISFKDIFVSRPDTGDARSQAQKLIFSLRNDQSNPIAAETLDTFIKKRNQLTAAFIKAKTLRELSL